MYDTTAESDRNARILKTVRDFFKLGVLTIPVRQDKTPYVEWKHLQHEMASLESILKSFEYAFRKAEEKGGIVNIAAVVGPCSGLLVLDFDSQEEYDRFKAKYGVLEKCTRSKTGRGYHCFLNFPEVPEGHKLKSKFPDGVKKVDFKASGFVILPPSIHESGHVYEWEVPFSREALGECPRELYEIVSKAANPQVVSFDLEDDVETDYHHPKVQTWRELLQELAETPEGSRNATALREEKLAIAAPHGHHLGRKKRRLMLRHVVDLPLILYPIAPRPSYADQVLSFYRKSGLEPKVAIEVRELQTALGLVAAGVGISVVPSLSSPLRLGH